jgi:glutaredoxin
MRSLELLFICGLLFSQGFLACRNHAGSSVATDEPSAEPVAPVEDLPPLRLADDSPNLLLTWVSDEGDFHVVESIGLVPEGRRQQVRVVVTDQAAGTGSTVYVADLTAKQSDGTYPVITLPRTEWEKLGADRRKTRLEALAPGTGASPEAAAANADGVGGPVIGGPVVGGPAAPAHLGGGISAIVYGADWCKPCHDAERYLKSLGVSVTKKDIEESRAAQAEMQQKLVRVKRAGAGIPVIDVMGKIFVGFSPGSLKQAVDAAKSALDGAASPKRG